MELSPREALIVLNLIPGLGSVRIQSLLEFFGSAELILAAPARLLAQAPRIGDKIACAIANWRHCTNLQAELAQAERFQTRIVTLLDEDYPDALRRMSDPPIVLYVRGQWQQDDATRAVSIVGSRMSTPYGMNAARRFGRELADAGCTIISGLARGIDTAAHCGALDAAGRTLAILGSGMAQFFPPENAALAEAIIDGHGAVVSEFAMDMRPSRTSFPQRNRLVAAWSKATLVAEAPAHSGALHTARLSADDYGNTVFAIPGSIGQPTYAGCHALIRDGAILCSTPQELLADMGWDTPARQLELFPGTGTASPATPPGQDVILAALSCGHDTLDALCSATGIPACDLTPQLMRLQVARKIIPLAGGRYQPVPASGNPR